MAVAEKPLVDVRADFPVLQRQFDNIFVMKFDDEGRCTEFSEWYVEPRK